MVRARVVLLIPHHDDRVGLQTSLRSIDEAIPVDVMVVDDGSAAPPTHHELVESFAGSGIVHLEPLARNQGIARAMNHGVRRCLELGYEFVARLDAGDRNRPGRLTVQLAAMDDDPTMGVLGAAVQMVSTQGDPLFVRSLPTTHEQILPRLAAGNQLVHPTMLLRATVLREVGGYPEDLLAAEDFGLVARLASITRLGNLPHVLVDKELAPTSISATRRRRQVWGRLRVIASLPLPWWRRGLGLGRNALLLATSLEQTTRIKQWLWGRRRD